MPDIPTEPDARTVLTNRRETITIETRGHTRRVETGTDVFTHAVPDDQDPIGAHMAHVARLRHIRGFLLKSCTLTGAWQTLRD